MTLSHDSGNCAGKIYDSRTALCTAFDVLRGIAAIRKEEEYTPWMFW